MKLEPLVRKQLLTFQRNEITEHHIYRRLAVVADSIENRRVLAKVADDEKRHYERWRRYTEQDVAPRWWLIWIYYGLGRLLGFTFAVKLMERGEGDAQEAYGRIRSVVAEAEIVEREENEHETELLKLLDEERLRYTGSIVLGLNDALVELTGALAGLTLALQNTRLIALTGVITGIAAAFSMAASEYLSTKTEQAGRHPLKASVYTGLTYMVTVLVLILPYLVLTNYFVCLGCTMAAAVAIIALFNYYVSVAQDMPFRYRFLEMACLSFGVAGLSFGVGFAARRLLGVEL